MASYVTALGNVSVPSEDVIIEAVTAGSVIVQIRLHMPSVAAAAATAEHFDAVDTAELSTDLGLQVSSVSGVSAQLLAVPAPTPPPSSPLPPSPPTPPTAPPALPISIASSQNLEQTGADQAAGTMALTVSLVIVAVLLAAGGMWFFRRRRRQKREGPTIVQGVKTGLESQRAPIAGRAVRDIMRESAMDEDDDPFNTVIPICRTSSQKQSNPAIHLGLASSECSRCNSEFGVAAIYPTCSRTNSEFGVAAIYPTCGGSSGGWLAHVSEVEETSDRQSSAVESSAAEGSSGACRQGPRNHGEMIGPFAGTAPSRVRSVSLQARAASFSGVSVDTVTGGPGGLGRVRSPSGQLYTATYKSQYSFLEEAERMAARDSEEEAEEDEAARLATKETNMAAPMLSNKSQSMTPACTSRIRASSMTLPPSGHAAASTPLSRPIHTIEVTSSPAKSPRSPFRAASLRRGAGINPKDTGFARCASMLYTWDNSDPF